MSDALPIPPLPDLIIEPLVRLALAEDLGRGGDITTDAVIPAGTQMKAVMGSREPGVAAGYDAARLALRLVDPQASGRRWSRKALRLRRATQLVRIEGSARSVLIAERTMLNFIGPLSGVATLTAQVRGRGCRDEARRSSAPARRRRDFGRWRNAQSGWAAG